MKEISVFVKEPGKAPRHIYIPDTLKNLQKIVGGLIEIVTLENGLVVICNEEGRLLGLPKNCKISTVNFCNLDFVGTVIFAGTKGEELADIPLRFNEFKKRFPSLFKNQNNT